MNHKSMNNFFKATENVHSPRKDHAQHKKHFFIIKSKKVDCISKTTF